MEVVKICSQILRKKKTERRNFFNLFNWYTSKKQRYNFFSNFNIPSATLPWNLSLSTKCQFLSETVLSYLSLDFHEIYMFSLSSQIENEQWKLEILRLKFLETVEMISKWRMYEMYTVTNTSIYGLWFIKLGQRQRKKLRQIMN